MFILKTFGLFIITAVAEISGCYLVFLWLRQDKPIWLLFPAGLSLAIFAWLLTLHPMAAGRTYAAYGGVYVATSLMWLWWIEEINPNRWDLIGVAVTILGMGIIVFSQHSI